MSNESVDTVALRRYANAGYILSPRDTFPLLDELDALRERVGVLDLAASSAACNLGMAEQRAAKAEAERDAALAREAALRTELEFALLWHREHERHPTTTAIWQAEHMRRINRITAALRDPTPAAVRAAEDEIARRGIEPPVGMAAAALRVAVDAAEREGGQ